jgi:hypothetical protein
MFQTTRFAVQELAEMRANNSGTVRITEVDEANLLHWTVMLYPVIMQEKM